MDFTVRVHLNVSLFLYTYPRTGIGIRICSGAGAGVKFLLSRPRNRDHLGPFFSCSTILIGEDPFVCGASVLAAWGHAALPNDSR